MGRPPADTDMTHSLAPSTLLLLLVAAAPATAQQTLVLPRGMDHVEGPSVFTYPFGRVDAALQFLADADQVTLGLGVITGMRFRISQQSTSTAAYTKNYRVTAYTVTTNAANMAGDPAVNIGGAPGTVVFQGPLNLPAAGPLSVAPAPFQIHLPFTAPYVFNGTQGNLLLLMETTDQGPVPGTYRIDAVLFRNNRTEGIVADIDTVGCSAGGASLALAADPARAVVGGALDLTLTSSAPGAFPAALVALAVTRAQQDLGVFGMPGCTGWVGPFAFLILLESGGAYPQALFTVPANPVLEGLAVFTQVLGLPPAGTLQGAVTSNGLAIRLGHQQAPSVHNQCAFRSTASWALSGAGEFVPVIQLEGIFP